MRLFFDVVLALLASFGLITLAWLFVGLFGRQAARARTVYAFIAADGLEEAALQQILTSVKWLQQWNVVRLQPVITSAETNPHLTKVALQYGCELWMPYDVHTCEM